MKRGKQAPENSDALSLSHISASQGNPVDKLDNKNWYNFFVHY